MCIRDSLPPLPFKGLNNTLRINSRLNLIFCHSLNNKLQSFVHVYCAIQKKQVASSVIKAVDAVNKALSKSTHLTEETTIVTESLTASVRTLEPEVDEPTVIAQSNGKSDSAVHLSPDTFSFMEGDTDIFKTEVGRLADIGRTFISKESDFVLGYKVCC